MKRALGCGLVIAVVAAWGGCAAPEESDADVVAETEAVDEAAAASCAAGVCEDAADEVYEACMRKGYEQPQGGCTGPASTKKPRWCAGLVEQCGVPTPGCFDPSCMRLNTQCATAKAPALTPTCNAQADEVEAACEDACNGEAGLPKDGDRCMVTDCLGSGGIPDWGTMEGGDCKVRDENGTLIAWGDCNACDCIYVTGL